MPEMILCPHCGAESVTEEYFGEYQIGCPLCGANGPYADSIDSAISAWNSLPRALTWTHEPPKVEGVYLMRHMFDGEQQGAVGVITVKTPFDYDKSHFMQFAGPIVLPVEVLAS